VKFTNLTGTSSIKHSTFHDSRENIFAIADTGTSVMALNVSNSEFRTTPATSPGNNCLGISAVNSANMSVSVSGSSFKQCFGSSFQYAGNDTSGGGTIDITGSSFEGPSNGTEVNIAHQGASKTVTFNIANNTMRQTFGGNLAGISVRLGSTSNAGTLLTGVISGNTIGTNAVPNSGSFNGTGMSITAAGAGTLSARVESNVIRQVRLDSAMFVNNGEGSATMNLKISKNDFSVNTAGGLALFGLDINAGSLPTDTGTMCLNLVNDNIAFRGDPTLWGINLQTVSGNPTINLQGYAGAPNDTTAINAFLDTRAATVTPPSQSFVFAGTIKAAPAACITP
jgi:hypothetical protein